jgi:SPP1 gp7 family putative phage head morphogenesis protein
VGTKRLFNHPIGIENEYVIYLQRLAKQVKVESLKQIGQMVEKASDRFKREARIDSWSDEVERDFSALLATVTAFLGGRAVLSEIERFFDLVSSFNRRQFIKVAESQLNAKMFERTLSLLGLKKAKEEAFLAALKEGWIADNVSLIKTIPAKLYPEIGTIIRRGIMSGKSVTSLRDDILEKFGGTKGRAGRIARDQILKLNADLTKYRLTSIGVEEYIWRDVGDSKVRDLHHFRNGKKYRYGQYRIPKTEHLFLLHE